MSFRTAHLLHLSKSIFIFLHPAVEDLDMKKCITDAIIFEATPPPRPRTHAPWLEAYYYLEISHHIDIENSTSQC